MLAISPCPYFSLSEISFEVSGPFSLLDVDRVFLILFISSLMVSLPLIRFSRGTFVGMRSDTFKKIRSKNRFLLPLHLKIKNLNLCTCGKAAVPTDILFTVSIMVLIVITLSMGEVHSIYSVHYGVNRDYLTNGGGTFYLQCTLWC